MATDLTGVLLGQWRASLKLRAIVTDILTPMRDEALVALDRIERMRDLDEAEGIWVDRLGAIVGYDRPATENPALDQRWGFEGAGEPFDRHPFRGVVDAIYPLPDTVYKRFIRARAVLVLGDGTLQTFRRAVQHIDPDVTVVDNRDMTVTVTTTLRELLELADATGALPRTAGVRIIYA